MPRPDRPIDKLEGFWISRDPSRALHVGWEDEETLCFDLFDSYLAAWIPESNDSIVTIMLSIRTGEARIER